MMYQIRLLNSGLGTLTPVFEPNELYELGYFKLLKSVTWSAQSQNGLSFLANSEAKHKAYICSEVSSTFDLAHKLCELNLLNDWDLVIAHSQNNGRGQLRSNWVSRAGNLYASLKLPLDPLFMNDETTALLGKYLAKSFFSLGIEVQTKWVNDLLIRKGTKQYKLVGILLEEKNNNLIMGFGVNVNHAPMPEELTIPTAYPPAKILDITDKYSDPLALCLRLVENLIIQYNNNKANAL